MNVEMADASPSTATPGMAGRTNYAQWDKVTSDLLDEVEKEEEEEIAQQKAALGLDGKYARSQAEAEEREKAKDVKKVKKTIDKYKKRESMMMATFEGLLGPIKEETEGDSLEQSKSDQHKVERITRSRMGADKRVITIADTSGTSLQDTVVLTRDLSHLESKMAANAMSAAKNYDEDAENAAKAGPSERSIFGIIKAFINNVHNCTVIIKCKIISGTIELHNCSNVLVRIESEATVATVQADLSQDITIEFRDAPSGKNTGMLGQKKIYWGEDGDDRIFHAGVKNMKVRILRDDFCETETKADYIADGAVAVGNATPEEMQFVTSVIDGKLTTEKVIRSGSTTGKNARAMTQRELDAEEKMREKAAAMAIAKAEGMIKVQDKDGNEIRKTDPPKVETVDEDVEEVFTPATQVEIKDIVGECEQNKARGNEAFGAGEYGQAILLYSLVLDKAAELPDPTLFPQDIIYSNRAACFLKLGQHEKAEEDAKKAVAINKSNVKAHFRRGLALHAMGRYAEALPILAEAHRLEPKNQQIKQALQFCEVRLHQEQRKRLEG